MLSRSHPYPKLLHLPAEILSLLVIERRGLRRVELDRLNLRTIDPQGDGKRLRPKRAAPIEKRAHNVLNVDRKAMNNVKRVWECESCGIVIRERRQTWNYPLESGAKLHHCRLHLVGSKECLAGDSFCRSQVLLHEHWRQRQHIANVIE